MILKKIVKKIEKGKQRAQKQRYTYRIWRERQEPNRAYVMTKSLEHRRRDSSETIQETIQETRQETREEAKQQVNRRSNRGQIVLMRKLLDARRADRDFEQLSSPTRCEMAC